MTFILQLLAFVACVAAPVYYLGVATTRGGLILLGMGLGCWLFIALVWRSYRNELGENENASLADGPTHPIAAILLSAGKSLFVHSCLASVFGVAWGLGYWTPPEFHIRFWQRQVAKAANSPTESSVAAPTARTDLNASVVATQFDNGIQFLTVVVTNPADGRALQDILLTDFVITAKGTRQTILTATQTTFEGPLAIGIIRDVSGSIISSDPFPEIILNSTAAVIESARKSLRAPAVSVVDFAGDTVIALPWTEDLVKLGPIPLRQPGNRNATAVANTIVTACRSLAKRPERRRLLVITDGGNTVASTFDPWGIVAEANRYGVAIDVVALPTASLTAERTELLKFMAEKTGGNLIDGASSTLTAQIAEVVKGWRKPDPAYRFSFQAELPVQPSELQASVIGHGTIASPPAGVATKPAFERTSWLAAGRD